MKNLYFNPETLEGTSNTSHSLVLPVEEDFNLDKIINIPTGKTQKLDENGEKIYLKECFRKEKIQILVCYEETTEVTDLPLMETIQKTNVSGEFLYLELLEDGDSFETTKPVNELGEKNEPILEEVQRKTLKGLPLYSKPIYEEYEYDVLDHTEETTEVTNIPVMIPTFTRSLVHLEEDIHLYTYEEVVKAYEKYLSEKTGKVVKLLLNINKESSTVNTGINILNLPVKGNVTFSRLTLEEEVDTIEIPDMQDELKYYVNSKLLADSKVVLSSPVKNITVKVSNPTNVSIDVKPIKILCSKLPVE